jgi:outer membrane murein-binding lipoprotein Lpp
MRLSILSVLAVVIGSGCVSKPDNAPTSAQIDNKRTEVHVLESEIDLNIRSMERLRQQFVHTNQLNAPCLKSESQSLDQTIAILRKTRDRLANQQKQLRSQRGDVRGEY